MNLVEPAETYESWAARFEHARTIEDILAAARAYVASIDAPLLSRLPRKYAPPERFQTCTDVAAYAYELVRNRHAANVECAALVEQMANVFSCASVRIAQLHTFGHAGAAGPRRSTAAAPPTRA